MKDNKTDQRNQEQTGSTSNQNANQQQPSTNHPVEQKEEKKYPNVVVENEENNAVNEPNKITDVPNKNQEESKEINNEGFNEERITNTPKADETGTNTRKEGVTL